MKLATRLILEEALEGESRDAVGRDYYEPGAEPARVTATACAAGALRRRKASWNTRPPQVTGRGVPSGEYVKGRTEALEDRAVELLARGLSVRELRTPSAMNRGGCSCRKPRSARPAGRLPGVRHA
ncbi:MAG: hypothetical protein EOQ42_00560 [Mesorhizobium sp.]|uniref:hypothetical protein n=1 Tax=Mesorhizobium sp. M00.F.Ca.ET.216.01.1.1 TaxID=2500528 RepID=UPI000FD730D0|nr:hypothetical protein [Mesorhizobium sp. M00.F.Ca.ET.216.01.1.1]RWB83053.1 MAG: hypothetical protein EOQ42_00560 [Mesorhizobium sp.]TGQ29971.1 hypothetical protein EN859_032440 [Mesorhizobium sp. M00.F.Ca.ET.216.01.1.1]TIT09026.1 MAG: hypothetical protein E5W85_21855 [Mesorhizobium sp.]